MIVIPEDRNILSFYHVKPQIKKIFSLLYISEIFSICKIDEVN